MSQEKEIGTLVVVVLKAQHLHQPSFYKQDPYAQVYFSGLKKRTKVSPKGGQHPVWDDELRFPVFAEVGKDKVNRILEIACYKEEQRGDDVLLGKGTVDIAETLKTGEFDDWVPLETSAGTRGQIYLEMTFYANSPPPVTRRPSKISPSDRLARPAAYLTQGGQPTSKSNSPSPQPLRVAEKPGQIPQTSVSQLPSTLAPAHASQHTFEGIASNGVTSSVVARKLKGDSLPPLPANSNPPDIGSRKKMEHPASLHPGSKPQNWNRATSAGRPLPETFPDQLRRRTLSDTPALAPPLLFSQLQGSYPAYSSGITSMTGERVSSTPSIVVKDHADDFPSLPFPTPYASSPGPAQPHESWGIYTTGGDYEPSGQVYVHPSSQGYLPAPTHGYPQTFSPSPRPMSRQSPHTVPGQPTQPYESPAITSPPPPHPQHSIEPPISQSRSPLPQAHNVQPQQQQVSYLPQLQNPFLPPQQPDPQPLVYTQTPHPTLSNQSLAAAPQLQQSLYSQTPQQSPFAVLPPPLPPPPPPPPPAQSQTPQPYASQPPRLPQSYFSPPPPPPPPRPPSSYSQVGQRLSNAAPVIQPPEPSQGPILSDTSSLPNVTPVIQSPTTASPQVLNTAPASGTDENIGQGRSEQELNTAELITVTEEGFVRLEEVRGTPANTVGNQANEEQINESINEGQGQVVQLKDAEGQEMCDAMEHGLEDEQQSRGVELREDAQWKQQEVERELEEAQRKRESEEQRKREEELLRREEELRKWEEERRRKEEEECSRREEERKRKEEEQRRLEEEERRRKEEERRRHEEEQRRRKEEERRRHEEEKHRRCEEEERKKQEDHRRQEEAQIQREREEAERRRKASEEDARRRRAEEAAAERRWQEELARIRARAEQEAADAAFVRAQIEAEEAERQRQEEADLALVRQVQEEVEREERLAQDRRRQEEADMEVARREQAHEEELERRRVEERRLRMEEADRELARRLDMELNLDAEHGRDTSQQRRTTGSGQH